MKKFRKCTQFKIRQKKFRNSYNIIKLLPAVIFLIASSFIYTLSVLAENNSLLFDAQKLPNSMYGDGDFIDINRDAGYAKFEGHATILFGKMFLSAQKITVMRSENFVEAEGDVKLIYSKEKVIASRIVIDLNTTQIRMDNAKVFSDPAFTDDFVEKNALGLTKAELIFDSEKSKRAKEIESELRGLREEYSNFRNLQEIKRNDHKIKTKIKTLSNRYGQLLARYSRTQFQPNAYLEAFSPKDKERFLQRRAAVERFNRENPDIVNQIANFTAFPSYVSIAAAQIIQRSNQSFVLNNAIITPCHCSSFEEPPIYGFSSQNAQIDVGNYVTLQGATFDVFSLPLFYAPWFKLSIKNKRETGFLYPSGYTSNNAGQEISVPFFIVLGDHADSTITYQNFSARGSQFQTEFRVQIIEGDNFTVPNSNQLNKQVNSSNQFYSKTSFIQDKKYSSDWSGNNTKINQVIDNSNGQTSTNKYEKFRGNNLATRWYNEESLNIPISYWGSIKTNGQFVSDNTYLSDFSQSSVIDPTSVVKGDTTPASRRFLTQELDAEYYGDNSVLSVRTQGQQDLFSSMKSDTPMRLPRVEFTLLPSRYFNSPFVLSNFSTWENIVRPGGMNFISLPHNSSNSLNNNQQNTADQLLKTQTDPYVEGKRFFTTSSLSLPLPANDYVNAYASVQGTGVQYYFPESSPYGEEKPYEGYMQYVLNMDVPIFSRLDLKDSENKISGNITQTIDPYVNFTYIPNVKRGYNFPTTYNLWYAQDNIATMGTLSVGVSASWTVRKQKFHQSEKLIERFLQSKEPSVADINYLSAALKEGKKNIDQNPNSIYQFSSQEDANKIFELWAQKELDGYYQRVLFEDLNQKVTWPHSTYYEQIADTPYTPVSISVSTGYNFLADKTAEELNRNAGANFTSPYLSAANQDILGNLTWNLLPFFPLNGGVSTAYSQVYKRLSNLFSNVSTNLPYHISLSYSHGLQWILAPNSNDYVEKKQDSASVSYNPVSWIQFGFQWSHNADPTAASVDTSDGRGYATAYSVVLTGIQDCMDIIVTRNKTAGIPEKQATYAIGVNLNIFGFPTGTQQVGDYLNRKLQN